MAILPRFSNPSGFSGKVWEGLAQEMRSPADNIACYCTIFFCSLGYQRASFKDAIQQLLWKNPKEQILFGITVVCQ
jgi:hypothetical protein